MDSVGPAALHGLADLFRASQEKAHIPCPDCSLSCPELVCPAVVWPSDCLCGQSLETLVKGRLSEPKEVASVLSGLEVVALGVLVLLLVFFAGFLLGRISRVTTVSRAEAPEVERPPRSFTKGKGLGKLITLKLLG